MKRIDAEFMKLGEATLDQVLNYYCVYVIWDSQAKKRATYIGYSLNGGQRLGQHEWLASPINGYIAFFDTKEEAKCVEAWLIDSGNHLDRLQEHNEVSPFSILNKMFKQHGKIKIYLKGYNPFSHPSSTSYKNETLHIMELDEENSYIDTFRKRKAA